MTRKKFAIWAADLGVPAVAIEQILRYAASLKEMKRARDAVQPSPPIYTLKDIVEMTDTNPFGFNPRANGLIIVGCCISGDPIAIDLNDEPGSVRYICHESMFHKPVREVSVQVAKNLTEMINGLVAKSFPIDYFDAKSSLAH